MAVCTKCGASVPAGNTQCPKCGSIFINYQSEVNSSLGGGIMSGSLANQLKALASDVESLENLMEESDSISGQIKEPVKAPQLSRGRAMKPFLIPGCILCGVSLMFVNEQTVGMFIMCLVIGIALIGIGYFASNGRIERSAEAVQAKYDADVKKQNELKERLSGIESRKEVLIDKIQQLMFYNGSELGIPDNYFYSDAIGFFADRILSGRSNTLAEAMDAYDEHIHRLKLEQAAFEAAEYQKQSANNLAAIQRESAALRRQGAVNTALNVANTLRHWD